jgi:hypothetical protein
MRRRSTRIAVVLLIAGFSIATSPARARADIQPPPDPPEGKRVPATIEVDWGVFADRVSRRHVVAAGETLRSIATKELGDASRWKAIAENNTKAAASPDRIAVGAVLWLPPTRSFDAPSAPAAPPGAAPPTTTLGPWYDAIWQTWVGRRPSIIGRATPGETADEVKAGGTLLLIPHADAASVLAAVATSPDEARNAISTMSPLTAPMYPDTLLNKEDPTVRIVCKYRLRDVTNQLVNSDLTRVRYDAAGNVVTKTWTVRAPGFPLGPAAPDPAAPSAPGDLTRGPIANAPRPNPVRSSPSNATSEPADDSGSRWPASTGVLVAIGGAALVAAMWLIRRRKQANPPPAPPPDA